MTDDKKRRLSLAVELLMIDSDAIREYEEVVGDSDYARGFANGTKNACDLFKKILEDEE